MTRPLRRVSAAVLVMFLVLLLNANYVQLVQAKSLRDDQHNSRQIIDRYRRERGAILAGDKVLAMSKETADRLKYLRTYPGGAEYAPVTGYYSLFGSTGIEHAEDDLLSGEDGRLVVDRLTQLLTGQETRGGSIQLTIDAKAQDAAWQALGDRKGAAVALDPRTGAVLALVSRPSYDPDPFASHDGAKVAAASERLTDDAGQPLLNRASARRYPPGSLFKVVTAAAALSSGDYKPSTRVPSPHRLPLPLTTSSIGNFAGESCGNGSTTTLLDALRISCNTAFAGLGLKLGADRLRDQARAFGIGSDIEDWPLDFATSVFPDHPNAPQTAQSAIGQFDVALTPLQAAMIASGVANDGVVMRPYLVDSARAPDLSVLQAADPQRLRTAVSPAVAEQLTQMMVAVVARGTGQRAAISGVTVAGKTGTAQHAAGRPPHAWFIGFAPAEAPRVAVAVVVEEGGGSSEATGGTVAAPIARAVMSAVLGKG